MFRSKYLWPIPNQFDGVGKITPIVSSMIPGINKKKKFSHIKSNSPDFFEKDCFDLLTSKHAQRGPAKVHASLPTVKGSNSDTTVPVARQPLTDD
jgi:hypothetical protein